MTIHTDDVEEIRGKTRAKNLADLAAAIRRERTSPTPLPLDDDEGDGEKPTWLGIPSTQASSKNPSGAKPFRLPKIDRRIIIGGVVLLAILIVLGLIFALRSGGQPNYSVTVTTPLPPLIAAPTVAAPSTPVGILGLEVEGPPPIMVSVSVTLATLWIVLIIILGFAETVSRRERFALDWWAPLLFVVVATFRSQFSHDWWLVLQTTSVVLVGVAVALNENRPAVASKSGNVWAQIFGQVTGVLDMTPLYQTGALLLALHYAQWAIMPYPVWISTNLAWMALILGGLFEVSRAPIITIGAVILGGLGGLLLDPWITMGIALLVVVGGAVFSSVGWLPTTSHQRQETVGAMGRSLTVMIRWDMILLATIAYFLVALSTHGNIVIAQITRLAGG